MRFEIYLQGIPAFRDFTIRDPLYFLILFQWKLAKKVDFRKNFGPNLGFSTKKGFKIRDPRYFVILFQWKLAKKVDFWKFLRYGFY